LITTRRSPTAAVLPLLPGLAAASLVALVARSIGAIAPSFVGEVFPAILIGLVVGFVARRPATAPGLRFASTRLLRIGVVLLGARLSIGAIADVGLSVVLAVALVIVAAFALAIIGGRLLGLPPVTVVLIAVGTAICGNSAIVATAPIVGADDRQVSVAVATITVFGMLAVLTYPLIGAALGMSDELFGRWAGVAVHDTSQVVAASFAFSPVAGDIAVVVKLVRNAAMAPVLFLIGAWWMAREASTDRRPSSRRTLQAAVPLFVLGFLLLAALNSFGLLDSVVAGRSLAAWCGELAGALVLVAVSAIGLGSDPRVLRTSGLRPFLAGLGVAFGVAVVGLALVVATPIDP
jgi:uncharacterized integral membrane protein (TIGR00698 family)